MENYLTKLLKHITACYIQYETNQLKQHEGIVSQIASLAWKLGWGQSFSGQLTFQITCMYELGYKLRCKLRNNKYRCGHYAYINYVYRI
jgi:hypothetical protein